MSNAVLPPSAPQVAHIATSPARRNLNPVEALEVGFALFRSTFAVDGWRYYIGAVPFVFCFIPIWVINGQIQISNGVLLMEATLLAGAYLFRVWMVSGYMRCISERAFGTRRLRPAGVAARAAAAGRLIAWKAMLSGAAVTTLPSFAGPSWFYTACQFASLEAQGDAAERHSLTDCLGLAGQWFGGSSLLLLMLFPLWIAVWLNGLILAMLVPQLLHSIFGVNTLLSTQMGIYALTENSAFWLSLLAGAWLALDPIVKCTFIVVYQHLRSRREGDDLRGLLAALPRQEQQRAAMVASSAVGHTVMTSMLCVLAAILTCISITATAHGAQMPTRSTMEETSNFDRDARILRLRQALDQESQRAIYRWHDAEHPSPPTWFDKLLARTGNSIEQAWNRLWNFLHKLWPHGLNLSLGSQKQGSWHFKDVRLWLALVAILTLVTVGGVFWLRQRREIASLSIPLTVAPIHALTDSSAASERSEDEWFALASQLEGNGELRFALRAAYFGLLAGLAQREWLTIRRDRTNREYLNEFTRRWRRRPQAAIEVRAEVPEKLCGSLRQFDSVWYGSRTVTPESVTMYRQNLREFLSHV